MWFVHTKPSLKYFIEEGVKHDEEWVIRGGRHPREGTAEETMHLEDKIHIYM